VFEDRVLRGIFVPKKDKGMGDWKKVHDEFPKLYSLGSIVRIMKSINMIWAGHVARMGE
jgi:hypothetical protein